MTSKRAGLAACRTAALLALATPTVATASDQGEFYQTVSVGFHPEDDQFLLVGTTFGLLVSTDDGASFHWICEQAVGYSGNYVPQVAVAADGAIYATTFEGLRVSRDGGCTWEGVGGEIGGRFAEDVAISADGRVWATTASGAQENDVFVASDGHTFDPAGIDVAGAMWRQIAAAPGHADRLYVVGMRPASEGGEPEPLLYRSDDGGESFVALDPSGWFPPDTLLLLLERVSPADPDVAFLRVTGVDDEPGGLYRTTDAGETWELVLELPSDSRPFGLAFGAGGLVIAGASIPCPGDPTDALNGCVFVSTDGGASWDRAASQPRMHCAGARPADGSLFACAVDGEPDFFALGRSIDADSWDPVLRLPEVTGPLECPAVTRQAMCVANDWPLLCRQLGVCPEPDAGPPPPPPPGPRGGCCDSGGDPASAAAILLLAALPLRRRARGAPL